MFSSQIFCQTRWSKCEFDKTKLNMCLDGEVKKNEFNKWYVAYECQNQGGKHYFWVAEDVISFSAETPFEIAISLIGTLLGTSQANYSSSNSTIDSSGEILPLIEQRKEIIAKKEAYIESDSGKTIACMSIIIAFAFIGFMFSTVS